MLTRMGVVGMCFLFAVFACEGVPTLPIKDSGTLPLDFRSLEGEVTTDRQDCWTFRSHLIQSSSKSCQNVFFRDSSGALELRVKILTLGDTVSALRAAEETGIFLLGTGGGRLKGDRFLFQAGKHLLDLENTGRAFLGSLELLDYVSGYGKSGLSSLSQFKAMPRKNRILNGDALLSHGILGNISWGPFIARRYRGNECNYLAGRNLKPISRLTFQEGLARQSVRSLLLEKNAVKVVLRTQYRRWKLLWKSDHLVFVAGCRNREKEGEIIEKIGNLDFILQESALFE